MKNLSTNLLMIVLVCLTMIGWHVLFVQKVDVLILARLKYLQAVNQKIDLSNGPCLGNLKSDWVLDITHLPRDEVDNLATNQCTEYLSGNAHHFVEMTPKGEIIIVR